MSTHLHKRLPTDDSPPIKQTNMACDEQHSTTTPSPSAPASTSLSFKSNHNSRRYRQHHLYWPLSGIIFMVSLSSLVSSEMIYRVDPLGKYSQCHYIFCLHSGLIQYFLASKHFFLSLSLPRFVLFILIILLRQCV